MIVTCHVNISLRCLGPQRGKQLILDAAGSITLSVSISSKERLLPNGLPFVIHILVFGTNKLNPYRTNVENRVSS